jgi:hypothetical protein
METFTHIAGVSQAIQLAVAPVFLLTAVGATLNVFATRIGRIIDRARLVEEQLAVATPDRAVELRERLRVLARRARYVNRAIGLSVSSGIFVSLVVPALFVSAVLRIDLALPIAVAFVVSLLCLAIALTYFLREVIIATKSLRFGVEAFKS